MSIRMKRFRGNESGVASIEFALLGTLLILLFAGGFDLVYMVNAKRDADRASMLIAHALATCPDSGCMSPTIQSLLDRKKNVLVRYPNASIEMYMILNKNTDIKVCFGSDDVSSMSDSTLNTSAKNILRDKDVGAAVKLTISYISVLPKALLKYISASGATYTGRSVDVLGNAGYVCS